MNMYSLRSFFFVILFCAGISSRAEAEWRFIWQTDPRSGEYSCAIRSDAVPLWPFAGGGETRFQIGIQEEGLIVLISDPLPFDQSALTIVSLSVDDQERVSRPASDRAGRMLTYREEDSVTLHRQFENGRVVRADLAYAPGRPITATIPLDSYRTAAAQYKGCKGLLLNSEGWFGAHMTSASADPDWLRWVRSSSPFTGPGVLIMTVDPRKEAQRSDVRPGDVIVGLNGKDIDVPSLIRTMKGLEGGAGMTLNVVREQKFRQIVVVRPRGEEQVPARGGRRAGGAR